MRHSGTYVCWQLMKQLNVTPSSSRVMFDEEGDNGLVLCDKYLPIEVLIEIFCHADCETLLRCHLVCKRWKMLMKYVWHKKAERAQAKPKQSFPWDESMPWQVYYLACTKKPYERNLVKNHSGAEGLQHWTLQNNGNFWMREEPPVGMPVLPESDELFKDRQTCFVTSYQYSDKVQDIILEEEGIHSYILDTYQPPIVVSEWYGCRWDCPAVYQLTVKLRGFDYDVIDKFLFKDTLEGEKQNQWLKVTHVFKDYGIGLRAITFKHGGRDKSFWAGHYGSKMAGACVTVKIPQNIYMSTQE